MAGTRRNRRTYDEMIQALRQKISKLEDRKRVKSLRQDPMLRLASKLCRMLRRAEETFGAARRAELAGATKAAYISLEGNLQRK